MRNWQPARVIAAAEQLLHRLGGYAARKPLVEGLIVAVLALLPVALLAMRAELMLKDDPRFSDPGWDHHAYIAMAQDNPFDFHLAPFGWRVGLPALARALPFGLQTSFLTLTFLATWATTAMVYLVMRLAKFERVYAVAGSALFLTLGWAPKFALMDFWLPDGLVYLFVSAAIACTLKRWPIAFALVVLFGVLVKENVIFTVPLFYTLQAKRPLDWKLALRTLLVGLPGVIALLAVRLAIPAQNGDAQYAQSLSPALQTFREYIPSYSYYELLRDIGWHSRLHDFRLSTWLLYTSGTWSVPILALAILGALRKPVLALRLLPFLVLVYAQLLFALNIERVLVVGFPAVLWLALEGLRFLRQEWRIPAWALLCLPLLLIPFQFEHADTIPIRFETETVVFLGWLVVLAAVAPQWRFSPSPSEGP